MEIYGRVRRAVRVEGKSQRAVAREFGLSRETVRKILEYAVPPGYQRQQPIKRPKLGPWLGVIDAILNDDKQRPVKQWHTSKRIFERLKDEHGFTGGYTIVKDYVRAATLRGQEVFVPLVHPAGEAQVDFGEALVVIERGHGVVGSGSVTASSASAKWRRSQTRARSRRDKGRGRALHHSRHVMVFVCRQKHVLRAGSTVRPCPR